MGELLSVLETHPSLASQLIYVGLVGNKFGQDGGGEEAAEMLLQFLQTHPCFTAVVKIYGNKIPIQYERKIDCQQMVRLRNDINVGIGIEIDNENAHEIGESKTENVRIQVSSSRSLDQTTTTSTTTTTTTNFIITIINIHIKHHLPPTNRQ